MMALVDKICTVPGSVNIMLRMLQGVWAKLVKPSAEGDWACCTW